ncbi:MAG: xanthine dehydrogenase accessory protein XdhC [Myxococcales bacterium FL481]|nr:MAG: xanthine dehydrogenase accessory protein XdhC [Myxococcales bacterium FL481]
MPASASLRSIFRAVDDLLSGNTAQAAALATVIGRSGSAPQIVGAKLLLFDDGRQLGTVGGGAIEQAVLDACRETLSTGQSNRVEADLVRDLAMCCGGSMEIFVEHLQASTRLIIVGGGHVAQALAPLAQSVGLRPIVVDDREALAQAPELADVELRAYDADELTVAVPDLGERDLIVIVSRDHQRDERALATALEQPHRYLGMIGSRRKVITVIRRVLRRYDERNRPRPDLSRVRAPIGLALGGRTPAEIAVSIVAEVLAVLHGGHGGAMSIVDNLAETSDSPGSRPLSDARSDSRPGGDASSDDPPRSHVDPDC